MFEIINKIQELKQGNDGVTKYYNTLKGLWKELDMFYDLEWTCVTNSTHYMKILERDWVFKFLAGLNKELDEVHKCISGKDPLPSVQVVFSEVRREKSRRQVMMGTPTTPNIAEDSTLVTTFKATTNATQRNQKKGDEKGKVWCDFCNKPRHKRETCWKLHGKTANWKSN